ncbi:glycosyltransferase [Candidatus Babeliales bacterium]|nr:glycosyltransferase [Candidatus Babeliales bacterium]
MPPLTHRYSNNISNKKILIIGPYPPPFGGVSIHIKRVTEKLKLQNNTVAIFNTATKRTKTKAIFSLLKKLIFTRPHIVYYNEPTESLQKLALVTLLKYLFFYQLVTIDHDCRLLYNFSPRKKKLFRMLMKRVNHAVVMGDTTEKCYVDNQVSKVKKSVESPFLPPVLREEKEILWQYPVGVHKFLSTRSPLLTANAFAPILIDGKDLYGFDMCIELIKTLKQTYPNIGLIFGVCTLGTEEQKKYFATIEEKIQKLKLESSFYFFFNEQEFWPLIKLSDLFIRPTLSDSFGISVQEAITVGTPAIASNVCQRPEGTILFEVGSATQLLDKTTTMLEKKHA